MTDAGLEHLKDLKQLVWLGLDGTDVSDAGVAGMLPSRPSQSDGAAPSFHLRVMADYSSSGIGRSAPRLRIWTIRHATMSHERLALSSELAEDRFNSWIKSYDKMFDNESGFDYDGFNAVGRELAGQLKTYLGEIAYVEFEPERRPGGAAAAGNHCKGRSIGTVLAVSSRKRPRRILARGAPRLLSSPPHASKSRFWR